MWPRASGGVCRRTGSVSHGGTVAVGPSRSSSSSAAHDRLPSSPQTHISHLECPIKSGSDSFAGALTSRRLFGHERPGSCPAPLFPPLSPPSGAPPPRRSGTIAGQRHFLKRVVVPVWGPRRLAGKEKKDGGNERPCGEATPENERLLSSAGCGCQSWLRLGRKRTIPAIEGEVLGVLRRSGPAEVRLRS